MTDHKAGLSKLIGSDISESLKTVLSVLDTLPLLAMIISKEGQYIEAFGDTDPFFTTDTNSIIGKYIHEIFSKKQAKEFMHFIDNTLTSKKIQKLQYPIVLKNNLRIFEASVSPLKISNKTEHVIWFARDITLEMHHNESMEFLAYHDPLTGLSNRLKLYQRLDEENSRCQRHQLYSALVFIDFDDFKPINDEFGHLFGDQVLTNIATRLAYHTREEDLVSRIGGDEFVLVLSMIGQDETIAIDHASQIASKLKQTIGAPIIIENIPIKISASIGISVLPKPNKKPQDILKEADEAMYCSKNKGKGIITTFQ